MSRPHPETSKKASNAEERNLYIHLGEAKASSRGEAGLPAEKARKATGRKWSCGGKKTPTIHAESLLSR